MEVRSGTRYGWSAWTGLSLVLLCWISTPILTLILRLLAPPGEGWEHLAANLLPGYVWNTMLLLLGVGLGTFLLGVGSAWAVSTYEFPGRRWFEWLLILPLSFPGYIMAYTYVGMLQYGSPLYRLVQERLDIPIKGSLLDMMNLPGAVFVLSMSLFPYVYLLARTSFLQQSRSWQEAALLLGQNTWGRFFKVALPMARPAIAAGLALAGMEVLNDYGTVKYFGVPTFTTGIFRAWFSMGDATTAIYLAAMLLLFVLLLIVLEYWQRGNRRYSAARASGGRIARIQLGRWQAWAFTLALALVVLLSFGLPFLQLSYWSILSYTKVLNADFFRLVLHSFTLAAGAGVLIVVLATVLLYAQRLSPHRWLRQVASAATLGYAIPGAVIAVGVMIPLLSLDQWLMAQLSAGPKLFLSGSLFALLFAYVVRFLAVGYNPVEAGFQKIGRQVHEASRMLGAGSWRTLWAVELPLLRASLLSGVLLVFVDLLKELPLTLILRPFNFHTLATKAFDLATNEMIAESSIAALVIVLTGILPILLLNQIIRRTR